MRSCFLLLLLLVLSCSEDSQIDPLKAALVSDALPIKRVMDSADRYEIQVKLTTVSRERDSIRLKDFQFQLNDSMYFYPASTVKLPVSILALESLQHDDRLDLDTPFFVEGDSAFTTFREDIRDIFAVSGNDTYNRLFEYLGKDAINQRLAQNNLGPIRISHRLSTADAFELTTRSLIVQTSDSTLWSSSPIINSPIVPFDMLRIRKGIGYRNGEEIVMEPMDFSERNYLPISSLHEIMKRLFFPELFSESERFDLDESHLGFLKESMALFPRDVNYTDEEYYDSYGKFFIYGDSKDPIPDHMTIYNKVGYAYGYLTDSAYIVDSKNELDFIISATIHVNHNQIFNDDQYEYDEVGIPFLAELGRQIHYNLIQDR